VSIVPVKINGGIPLGLDLDSMLRLASTKKISDSSGIIQKIYEKRD